MRVRSRAHEVPVADQAGGTLRAACDDGTVTVGPGTTAFRAELPDRAALRGLVQQIMGPGHEVAGLHLLTPGSW